ncbi:hypothetical protein D3C80_1171710 [compost metagenome]
MLTGNFLQRAQWLIHGKARGIAVIENIVSQHAQSRRDRLGIPADHRFGVTALHQLLHFLRMMQADRNMFLEIQPYLKRAQQPFVFMIFIGRQHV